MKWFKKLQKPIRYSLAALITAFLVFTQLGNLKISIDSNGIVSFTMQEVQVSAAISLSTLGTNQDKVATNPFTIISNLALSAGDTVFVCVASDYDNTANKVGYYASLAWGSATGTRDVVVRDTTTSTVVVSVWSFNVASGGTNNLVITWTDDASRDPPLASAYTVYKATGISASSPKDKGTGTYGVGTTATTNATGTLSQADELIIVASAVEDEVDDAHGTWSTSAGYIGDNVQFAATNGGGDSSNVQAHSAAKVVSATDTMQGSDGTHDSSAWAGCIVSYKMASGASITNTPDSKAFGVVAENTTYYAKGSAPSNPVSDGECTFTITNNGTVSINISVKAINFTGGVGWTLTSSAPGENTVRLTTYYSGQNPASGVILTTSDQTFYSGLAASGTLKWDFKMETGTFTDGVAKSSTITLTATAA